MFPSTKKKIWFGIFTTLIIILSGYGVFVFKERQEHKHAAAKIAEYCQNPKIELATSEYNIEDGMFPKLRVEIKTKKFDDIRAYVTARYRDENITEGVKENVNELCSASTSKMPPRTFLFWYQLNDEYSVMGVAENKAPAGLRGRDLENTVSYVVVKNDTQTVVHSFEFITYMDQPIDKKGYYRRINKKDIKEIVYLILKDNAPEVL
ncbi:MAG: hypothetical protein CR972_05240 [Candidatus Moraniibacteriota bacterium]|nr:MAG: hypothetical protein CR972_05240 [Candidatus Moranbacteria bacterium]